MNRKKFLIACGLGAAGILGAGDFPGCSWKENPVAAPEEVDFTLDLDDPANADLKRRGGYVFRDGVIVARTSGDAYVAVSSACTHRGTSIDFRLSENRFVCLSGGSEFDTGGKVLSGPARLPLMKYNTLLRGKSLRVFS